MPNETFVNIPQNQNIFPHVKYKLIINAIMLIIFRFYSVVTRSQALVFIAIGYYYRFELGSWFLGLLLFVSPLGLSSFK